MKIALIGSFGIRPDEGLRKLCLQFEAAARADHEVLTVQTGDFCSGRAWTKLRKFRPDVLHYLTGPTLFSLVALYLNRLTLPGHPRTIATGTRPYFGLTGRLLMRLIAPDYYLAQARRWQRLFAAAGTHTMDLPNGVDTCRFQPILPGKSRELKARWGLLADKPVILHVGHIRENRNLESLTEVQLSGRYQVWIVGSESQSEPGLTHDRLVKAGCLIHTKYVSAIEEVYQAADAYVFTVKAVAVGSYPKHYQEVGVIDFPLSVLEAMAANLPLVTTRHDAIEYFIGQPQGVSYFDGSGADLMRKLDRVFTKPQLATRPVAQNFELSRVMAQLDSFYGYVAQRLRTHR